MIFKNKKPIQPPPLEIEFAGDVLANIISIYAPDEFKILGTRALNSWVFLAPITTRDQWNRIIDNPTRWNEWKVGYDNEGKYFAVPVEVDNDDN